MKGQTSKRPTDVRRWRDSLLMCAGRESLRFLPPYSDSCTEQSNTAENG